MKISFNWIRKYIDLDNFKPEEVSDMLTDLGLEVEGMETFESLPGSLEGVVVGEVVECTKHPNADKLSLTRVDVGTGELLPIVCGAPNVAAGQRVLVATVGTTLYPAGGESFQIKEAKIRGEISRGMICAEDELGLGQSHEGIIVLPSDVKIGTPAGDYFKIEKDTVFEIGLTPNRSDATNHIGVARDLAATLKCNFQQDANLTLPLIESFKVQNRDLKVEVAVENIEACPRYSGLTITGVKTGDSPDWLKNRLKAIGVRPINNIVDTTNYVLHETGQPLHAFDLAQVAGNKIIVKTLPEGTTFQTLDEVERKLYAEDLMICDGNSSGLCIAGVFGGIGSGVTEATTEIFLESAHFNPAYIRRSKTRHNLHTDAAFIFEKGSDPAITVYALKRAALLIQELAGGEISSEIIDIYPEPAEPAKVEVEYGYIARLIGLEIPKEKIKAILEALDMKYIGETEKSFTVEVPTNKADVTRSADIVEEILRVYGLNNIPVPTTTRSLMVDTQKPDIRQVRNITGHLLAANGFHEMMALSLSGSTYYKNMLPRNEEELVFINNTSNAQLDIMRPDLLISGLEAVLRNQNHRQSDLKLFEFGYAYKDLGNNNFEETEHLSLFVTGNRWPESWIQDFSRESDAFTIKSYVRLVLRRLGIEGFQQSAIQDEIFDYGIKYHRGEKVLVSFGKVSMDIQEKMDIKNPVFHADFRWDEIMQALPREHRGYSELNKFPGTRRDLALVVDASVGFEKIEAIARKTGKKLLKEINLFDVFTDETKLGEGKKSYAVSFGFEDPEKTLNDNEIETIMQKLIAEYEEKLGATIRR